MLIKEEPSWAGYPIEKGEKRDEPQTTLGNIQIKQEPEEINEESWEESANDNSDIWSWDRPCRVNLHRGVNIKEISSCRQCKQITSRRTRIIPLENIKTEIEPSSEADTAVVMDEDHTDAVESNSHRFLIFKVENKDGDEDEETANIQKDRTENQEEDRFVSQREIMENPPQSSSAVVKAEHASKLPAEKKGSIPQSRANLGKPFECNQCHKKFSKFSKLQSHSLFHSGERPYECKVCRRRFAYEHNLKSHFDIIHEGKKRHKCDVCNKTFMFSFNLKKHSKVYSGEKLLKCKKCEKRFPRRCDLDMHMLSHKRNKSLEETTDAPAESNNESISREMILKNDFQRVCRVNLHRGINFKKIASCRRCAQITSRNRKLIQSEEQSRNVGKNRSDGSVSVNGEAEEITSVNEESDDSTSRSDIPENDIPSNSEAEGYGRNSPATNHFEEKEMDKCNICNKTFRNKIIFSEHLMKHSKDQPYLCEHCGKRFWHQKNLNSHYLVHSENKPHKCDKCDKGFVLKSSLEKHSLVHLDKEHYLCHECGKILTDTYAIKKHALSHSGEQSYECNECHKKFSSKSNLNKHRLTHLKNRLGENDKPDKEVDNNDTSFPISTKEENPTNNSESEDKEKNKCNICGKTFRSRSYLNDHKLINHSEKASYECKECGKRFLLRIRLKKHLASFHPGNISYENNKFQNQDMCEQEEVQISKKDESASQKITFSGLMNGQCEELNSAVTGEEKDGTCDKALPPKVDIKKNISGEKSYQCSSCPKNFKTAYELISHSCIHSGKNLHKCNLCDKQFAHKDSVKKHLLVHSKEKAFECNECHYTFPSEISLQSHRSLIHSVKASFKCELCSKNFSRKDHLENHFTIHSTDKPNENNDRNTSLAHEKMALQSSKNTENSKESLTEPMVLEYIFSNAKRAEEIGKELNSTMVDNSVKNKEDNCDEIGDKFSLKEHAPSDCENTPYKCNVCLKRFKSPTDLKTHSSIHLRQKEHKCDKCGKMFPYKQNLKKHSRVHSQERPFQCDKCHYRFSTTISLKTHYSKTHLEEMSIEGSSHECKQCRRRFSSRKHLRAHLLIHEKDINLQEGSNSHAKHTDSQILTSIENCNEPLSNRGKNLEVSFSDNIGPMEIKQEEPVSTMTIDDNGGTEIGNESPASTIITDDIAPVKIKNEEPASRISDNFGEKIEEKCNICKKTFPNKINLKKHLSSHYRRLYECTECSERFLIRSNLKAHLLVHSAGKSQDSNDGQKKVEHRQVSTNADNSSESLSQPEMIDIYLPNASDAIEVKIEESTENRNEKANVNDQTSLTVDVTKQVSNCLGKKSYQCHVCAKRFKFGHLLKSHLMVHLKEKPHKCEQCGKQFVYEHNLKSHVQAHSKERPFERPENFETAKDLQSDSPIHSAKKSYGCKQCDKRYTRPENLKRHLIMHSEERPFECGECHYRFPSTISLNTHLKRNHSGSKSYEEIANKRVDLQTSTNIEGSNESQPEILGNNFSDIGGTMEVKNEESTVANTNNLLAKKDDNCGKESRGKFTLKKHVSSHLRPHYCNICPKRFKTKCHLKSHLLVHSGEKPHTCEQCGKQFAHKHNLKSHLLLHQKERPFECKHCHYRFLSIKSLKHHSSKAHSHDKVDLKKIVRSNLGMRPYHCNECPKRFKTGQHLQRHLLVHSGELPHKCDQCGKGFTRKDHLKRHLLFHSRERPFECKLCHYRFSTIRSLKYHRSITHSRDKVDLNKIVRSNFGRGRYRCNECPKTFKTGYQLKSHSLVHSGEKPHKCEQCGKQFARKQTLQVHLLVHSGERPHKCDQCGKGFISTSHLKKHLRFHSKERPFECKHCHYRFSSIKSLKYHRSITHSRDKVDLNKIVRSNFGRGRYRCNECPKRFKTGYQLKSHSLVHSGVKAYKCEHCGKQIARIGSFRRHLMIHSGESPFQCIDCPKSFKTAYELKHHSAIHSEIRPYKCDQCDKRFAHKQAFEKHVKNHSREKPFKCDKCPKKFMTASELNNHTLIHLGIKPLKCGQCDRRFGTNYDLKRHGRLHSTERRFECNECHYRFTTLASLNSHISKYHLEVKSYHECKQCHQQFSSRKDLRTHLPSHSEGIKVHESNNSQEEIANEQNDSLVSTEIENSGGLLLRLLTSENNLPHTSGTMEAKIEEHIPPNGSAEKEENKCSVCDKAFRSKIDLEEHLPSHSAKKTHKCNSCDKTFSRKSHLERHLLLHLRECTKCGKRFKHKYSLKRHSLTHSENKTEVEIIQESGVPVLFV